MGAGSLRPRGVPSISGARTLIDHVNNLKLSTWSSSPSWATAAPGWSSRSRAWLESHDVVFAGSTIPFVLMPHFVSPGQLRRVRARCTACRRCSTASATPTPSDGRLREELALSGREDALIRLDPGFPRPLRICRLDAFLQGYEVKFLEFNADSPAGIGYTDVLARGLRRAIELPR